MENLSLLALLAKKSLIVIGIAGMLSFQGYNFIPGIKSEPKKEQRASCADVNKRGYAWWNIFNW